MCTISGQRFRSSTFCHPPANFCSSGCLGKLLVLEGFDRAQKVLEPCPTTGGRRRAPPNVRSLRPRNGRVSRSVLESKASGMHPRSMASLTEFSLADATAILTRTPATLNALLRGLPNIWVHSNEGKDVVGT
jgi:hypothetical protein